ncbi:hypothetical protein GIB67_005806 [Kingdonia uniflora]|uniref:Uncharacterized protein n=1 Tax=Kingdonia uniflora TaxID=39325 RepID=A0A7J7MBK3_9MAGN|nr:hypothetical protein GIB67_005806 [Kingdonia uniflora]
MVAGHGKSLHYVVENLQIMEIWMILKSQEEEGKRRIFSCEFSCLIYWKVITLSLTIPSARNFCKPCLRDAFIRKTFVRERTCHGSRRHLRTQKNVMKCPSCPTDISNFL